MKKTLFIVIFLVSGITIVNAQFYSNLNFSLNDSLLVVKNTEDNSVKLRVLGNIGGDIYGLKGILQSSILNLLKKLQLQVKTSFPSIKFMGTFQTHIPLPLGIIHLVYILLPNS